VKVSPPKHLSLVEIPLYATFPHFVGLIYTSPKNLSRKKCRFFGEIQSGKVKPTDRGGVRPTLLPVAEPPFSNGRGKKWGQAVERRMTPGDRSSSEPEAFLTLITGWR
jgi:hypothetical protein